ncbi:MAG: HIT family protein [Anaerolineaceae bacterium]|nr:MAG: HIT family protein [Anaerolineaceae bacterium]
MHNHAPLEYICPFCLLVQGSESIQTQLRQTDIVFQTADVTAFIATRRYPQNEGHVLIIPNLHFENIYDLPVNISMKIHALSREVALAMKSEYRCDGIMLRQHNEPAGDQNIWHYHLHVIPRYLNDDFHNAQKSPFDADERAQFARKLRTWFGKQHL